MVQKWSTERDDGELTRTSGRDTVVIYASTLKSLQQLVRCRPNIDKPRIEDLVMGKYFSIITDNKFSKQEKLVLMKPAAGDKPVLRKKKTF